MALTLGTRLGPYEILGALGVGGMGEVYRARDTRLDRDVAIKILPEAFAADVDRVARFQREAKVLASLNHPHIAAIYGLEEAAGVTALVMELVDGEDLSQRLARGAIPLDEALPIAKQIAAALEAAHEQGIIHRDLKPANIKVRADGTVKVLDFGLAKAMEPVGSAANISLSPTITTPAIMTGVGAILGTAAYMSPEQAKGRLVDKRSDVWAFGCVLYEMLTAKRAFAGEDVADTIAAVIRGEPDWSALPAAVPDQIRLLLKRCLEKDRHARVSDIAVARFLLTETSATAGATPHLREPRSRRQLVAGSIGLMFAALVLLAIATWVGTRLVPRPVLQPARFAIVPPATQPLAIQGADRDVVISPDGSQIVYRASSGALTQLMVRGLNELDARPLTGPMQIREPFMSPDGRWVGFFVNDEMRKVAITGGAPITICKVANATRGASWGTDDNILFSVSDKPGGLWTVPSDGGEPKTLTVADGGKGESGHFFPFVLPGGGAVLFTIASGLGIENAQVAVLDLKTGQRKILVRGASDAKYVDAAGGSRQPGYLVYAAAGALRAARFDRSRLELVTDSVPVVEKVVTVPFGEADYALSLQGTLVYVPGDQPIQRRASEPRSLVWVNRQGQEEAIKAPLRPYAVARLSPDGTRVALDIRDQTNDIWTWDLARQTLVPLNLDPGVDISPVWTPDGRRIIWASSRGGGNPNMYWQSADGTGVPERLTTNGSAQLPTSVHSDGTQVVFFSPQTMAPTGGGQAYDIGVLALPGASPPQTSPLITSNAAKSNPEISPDGHWIAYQSDESGQMQIYVRPFPKIDNGRWLISPAGGTRPVWAHNGRELFYLDGNGLLTSVPVQVTATSFSAGNPTKILNIRYYAGATTRGFDLRAFDISPDGRRFLMIKESAQTDPKAPAPSAGMVLVLNWLEELKARIPVR